MSNINNNIEYVHLLNTAVADFLFSLLLAFWIWIWENTHLIFLSITSDFRWNIRLWRQTEDEKKNKYLHNTQV